MKYIIIPFLLLFFGFQVIAQNHPDPGLRLPWAEGDVWWLHHGPHDNSGNYNSNSYSWSSIDFAPATGMSPAVFAARGGIVTQSSCSIKVVIDHGDGWFTGYFHLQNIPAAIAQSNGTYNVPTGAYLGNASDAADCSGSAGTPHLHLSFRYGSENNFVPMDQYYIGGWQIIAGNDNREGKLIRAGKEITTPRLLNRNLYDPLSSILNDGTVGQDFCSEKNLSVDGTLFGEVDLLAITKQKITFNATMQDWTYKTEDGIQGGNVELIAGQDIICNGNFNTDQLSKLIMKPELLCNIGRLKDQNDFAKTDLSKDQLISINIFPNPANDEFALRFELRESKMLSATLYNFSGRVVQAIFQDKNFAAGKHIESINIDDLESGMYILKLNIGGELHSKQLVII